MSDEARFDVTSFGEAMLRLSVPQGVRLAAADRLEMHVAGAESNVLAALAQLGRRCGWVSALPQNPLGQRVVRQLQQAGIDHAAVVWQPNGRLGTYYVEFAVPPRGIQVYYDRADSCVTTLDPAAVEWDYLLDTRLLHLTGITPPLSATCHEIVAELIRRAKAQGVPVSFDVNYRGKLWSAEAAAAGLMPLMQGVDLLLCSQRDAQNLFGCHGSAKEIVSQLAEKTAAKQIVVSLANEGVIGWDGAAFMEQPAHDVVVIDRIGAGDALAAGVIDGWLAGDLGQGLRYGTMMAALALSQHGDMLETSRPEVEALLANSVGTLSR